MAGTLASAQRTADTAGPDVLVTSAAGLLAWAVWAWGALGLALTAASALPGMLGGAARLALHVVLPAGARRSAALALGLGLGVAGPLLGTAALLTPTPAAADTWTPASAGSGLDWPVAPTARPVPDWPATAVCSAPLPDWPAAAPAAGTHVVVRGECLWHIASDRLLAQHGRTPTDGEVAAATQRLVAGQRRRHRPGSRPAAAGPGPAPPDRRERAPPRPLVRPTLGAPDDRTRPPRTRPLQPARPPLRLVVVPTPQPPLEDVRQPVRLLLPGVDGPAAALPAGAATAGRDARARVRGRLRARPGRSGPSCPTPGTRAGG